MNAAKVAAALRRMAEREDEYAAQQPLAAPNARIRAAAYRFQSDHVEAGTWTAYLDSIGRGVGDR